MKTTGPSRNEWESTTLMDEQNQEEIKNSSTPFPVSSSIPNLLTSLWICNNLYELKKKKKKAGTEGCRATIRKHLKGSLTIDRPLMTTALTPCLLD